MKLSGCRCLKLALIVVLCVLATAGCRRKTRRTTINNGSDIFTTDNFPGDSVQTNNVSDDKRAMSMSGQDYDNNLAVWFNGNRGQAIVSYSSTGGTTSSGLCVHYFNGETFTPPVNLRALDQNDPFNAINLTCVAWINTENHASDAAQARNGDALLFWTDTDHKDNTLPFPSADEQNTALFMSYFDLTYADDISHRYGFSDEVATQRIDAQDENGEDVISVGLLSDGLCGQASWFNGTGEYSWGDDTTSVECLFVQRERNSAVIDGSIGDQAMYAVRFDPAAVTPEDQPIPASLPTRLSVLGFGASDLGTTSGEVQEDGNFITYNNTLIMRVIANTFSPGPLGFNNSFNIESPVAFGGEDITLQTLSFDLSTGVISTTSSLQGGTVVSGDPLMNNAQFVFGSPSVFGSDEGLACTVVYDTQLINSAAGGPNGVLDSTLWIAEINPATGGVLEMAQLSGDNPTETDPVDESDVKIQISRNGDYIWAAWRQVMDTNAGASNDSAPQSDGVFARQYITTRPDGDGLFTIPTLTDSLSGVFSVAVPTVTSDVTWYQFQGHLGYICGLQSDPDVMHILFQRSDTLTDEVFDARLHADLVPVSVLPTVTLTSFEVFEEGVQNTAPSFEAVDSGDGGGIFAAYTDDIDPVGTDLRVFAEDQGPTPGFSEVDSDVTFRQATFVNLIATPPGQDIGVFNIADSTDDEARIHGAEVIHVFFDESRTSENYSSDARRTRAFVTNSDATFTDSFTPNVTPATFQEPFTLDLPNLDPNASIEIPGIAVQGNTVGIWMEFQNRLYYQEFNPDGNSDNDLGWRNIDGVSDPALIDDDTSVEVYSVEGLYTQSCTCDKLDRAMIFWVKHFSPDFPFDDRLQVRVRGTGN